MWNVWDETAEESRHMEKEPTRWNVVYTDTGAYLPMSLAGIVFSGEGVAFKGRFLSICHG